jgi:hypothetical protein
MLQTITSSESYIILSVVTLLALVALIYLLSPKMSLLDDTTVRGAEIRMRLRELVGGRRQYPGNIKNKVLAAYVDIALEHHKAIWLLTAAELNGSALALVRPIYETYLRALWISMVASADEIEKASRDELDWLRIKVLDDIKRAYSANLAKVDAVGITPTSVVKDEEATKRAELGDSFFQSISETVKILHCYTHPGGLLRRFTGDEVKPNYSEDEIAEALFAATWVLLYLVNFFFASIGRRDEALETRTLFAQFLAEFDERLGLSH